MKIGIAILSGMAGLWAAWCLYAAHLGRWAYAAGVILALVPMFPILRRRLRPRTTDEARRIRRLVGMASFAEVVAIVVGVQILVHAGRPDLIVCLIAAAVGLHFLPLARWMPMPTYYVSGLMLVAAAGAGMVIPAAYRVLFVAGAASAILWLTALSLALAAPGPDSSAAA